jgi:hypothetical protein
MGQVRQQGQTDPCAAVFGAYVQVLEVHARAPCDGAVARVVQGEADWLLFPGCEHRLGYSAFAEQRASEVAGLSSHLTGELLDFGKLDDEPVQDVHVVRLGWTDAEGRAHRNDPTVSWSFRNAQATAAMDRGNITFHRRALVACSGDVHARSSS